MDKIKITVIFASSHEASVAEHAFDGERYGREVYFKISRLASSNQSAVVSDFIEEVFALVGEGNVEEWF